jgi:hypothetical protein
VIKPWLQKWLHPLTGAWRDRQKQFQLVAEYSSLAGSRLMMADLCARNYVFGAGPDTDSLFAAGIVEGRRRAIYEILDFARIDPQELGAVVVRNPRQEDNDG